MQMMESAPDRTARDTHGVRVSTLLFTLLGAPVAWSIHLGVVYLLVSVLCAEGAANADLWIHLSGVPFLAVSVMAGAVGWRKWRMLRAGAGWKSALARPRGSAGLLLTMGIVAAAGFSMRIVLESPAPLFIATCAESLP
jgi:hypothetical protein